MAAVVAEELPVLSPVVRPVVRPATRGMTGSDRIHYLDNLRTLAMMLGVFLHAAFAYADPSQSFWLATDPQSSRAIDATIWFIHLFRMGLFFLVSGYFAKLVLVRKGIKRLLWQRTIRLVIPFLLFYPFLLGAMTVLIVFGVTYVDKPKGLMGLIAEASKHASRSESGPAPGTMHLWFLYYLIFFTLIAAVASRFTCPRLEGLFRRHWLFGLAPLVLLPGIVGAGIPLPGPESFVPTWWPFAFYGWYYWAGWQLFGRERWLESLRPIVGCLVGGSLLLFVPYYFCMPVLDLTSMLQGPQSLPRRMQGIACLLTAYLSVALTVASLILGKQFLSRPSTRLKFLADSSYWVYLIHLPIVLFLQTLLIPVAWNMWLKLSLTLVATFSFCLATYVVFVRYTLVGWLLHGKRSFP